MLFENLIPGLDLNPQLLGGNPAFQVVVFTDRNPLSGNVKRRHLEDPNDAMRSVHRQLISLLRKLKVKMPHATAFKQGDSPLKNVERHKGNRFFYLVDLKSAYRQIDIAKLAEVLCAVAPQFAGQKKTVQEFLTQYCMSQFGGLPIGAPASPDLFNLYCAILLDRPMGEVCARYGLTYTRYCDDLTISGTHTVSRQARRKILEVIRQAGFRVNYEKVKFFDLAATHKGPFIITGVALELGGRTYVPRDYLSQLQGMLNLALKGDFSLVHKVNGAMSVFHGLTNPRQMNATERRILRVYRQFQRLAKGENQRGKAPTSM